MVLIKDQRAYALSLRYIVVRKAFRARAANGRIVFRADGCDVWQVRWRAIARQRRGVLSKRRATRPNGWACSFRCALGLNGETASISKREGTATSLTWMSENATFSAHIKEPEA